MANVKYFHDKFIKKQRKVYTEIRKEEVSVSILLITRRAKYLMENFIQLPFLLNSPRKIST